MSTPPIRKILNMDAIGWLETHSDVGAIVTGLPDSDELQWPMEQWRAWFSRALQLCMRAASPHACAIFCQTDRKHDGHLVSKCHLMLDAAEAVHLRLLWHKIVLRRKVGGRDLYRPTYMHLMAFSNSMSAGAATTDVMQGGKMIYANAMGLNAATFAVRFAASKGIGMIVDPFCGRGTVPAVANALGLDAVGVDIDAQQCAAATALQLSPDLFSGDPRA